VSLQMAILKVLSCHPEGCATIAALNADLAILNTSGRDWTDRTKRLAACVPELHLFGQRLVVRSDAGWQITATGRAVLLVAEEQSMAIREVRGSLDAPASTPRPANPSCQPTGQGPRLRSSVESSGVGIAERGKP
jgi:hypothetical protein